MFFYLSAFIFHSIFLSIQNKTAACHKDEKENSSMKNTFRANTF